MIEQAISLGSQGSRFSLLLPTVVFILFLVVYQRQTKSRSKFPLPSGPTPFPVVGNWLQWSRRKNGRVSSRDESSQGLTYYTFFGRGYLLVNTHKAAIDLLEKRASIYASPGPKTELGNLLEGGKRDVLNQKHWIDRKTIHLALSSEIHTKLQTLHEQEARKTISRVLENPLDTGKHLKKFGTSVALRVVYGYETKGANDPLLKLVERTSKVQRKAENMTIRDSFPILQRIFPLDSKSSSITAQKEATRVREKPFALALRKNTKNLCSELLSSLAEAGQRAQDSEEVVASLCSTIAQETHEQIAIILASFMRAMALHPHVQSRAQAELDIVTDGTNRLPSFSHRASLPYLNALVKEVLRWEPPSPIGRAHLNHVDDIYNGTCVPKDTIVVPDLMQLAHDSTHYPIPHDFKPERFLKKDSEPVPPNPYQYVFGFGRRVSPASTLIKDSLFILIATLLSTTEIHFTDESLDPIAIPRTGYHRLVFMQGVREHRA